MRISDWSSDVCSSDLVGDVVEEDAQLVDMLTDKAAVELSSPVAGRVLKIHGVAGDKIAVGGALVTLETDASASESSAAETAPATPAASQTIPAIGSTPASGASPALVNGNDSPARSYPPDSASRSEEHTSELQYLMRISYTV